MGNKYKVECLKSKKWLKQRYYWRVKTNSNGKILLKSEMYVHKSFVISIAKRFAKDLTADLDILFDE